MHKYSVILCSLIAAQLFAQNQGNIWYFGDHAGLDFNSGSPVAINGGQTYLVSNHNEGTASLCDSTGSLLFYTNGQKVWDRNHLIMPYGTGLMGNLSSTQAALILPQPGSSRFYYIFTTDAFFNANLDKGLRYSVVDMCLNNGNGDIMYGQKNIKIVDTVAEKLTAVRHANGTDYWVITHKYFSDAFYALHLSANGIVDTVISHIGSVHPTGTPQSNVAAIGQLKASPDGHKLAIGNGNSNHCIAEYFDFDPLTGIVSNGVDVQWDTLNNVYGISFSPDNSKLYFAGTYPGGIWQFDLTAGAGDPDSVRASRTLLTNSGSGFIALQLGPDGKIYATEVPMPNSYIAVINNPNVGGLACNFMDSAISLNGHDASMGLPNFLDSYHYHTTTPECPLGFTEENTALPVSIYPTPISSQANVKFNRPLNQATLKLYNVFGECVLQIGNLTGSSIVVECGGLPEGNYFLQIIEGEEILTTQRILVLY